MVWVKDVWSVSKILKKCDVSSKGDRWYFGIDFQIYLQILWFFYDMFTFFLCLGRFFLWQMSEPNSLTIEGRSKALESQFLVWIAFWWIFIVCMLWQGWVLLQQQKKDGTDNFVQEKVKSAFYIYQNLFFQKYFRTSWSKRNWKKNKNTAIKCMILQQTTTWNRYHFNGWKIIFGDLPAFIYVR